MWRYGAWRESSRERLDDFSARLRSKNARARVDFEERRGEFDGVVRVASGEEEFPENENKEEMP